jgi:transposase
VRLTDKTVELFQHGKRVAAHRRSYQSGRSTTEEEHRPKSHQRYLAWTPSRILEWVKTIGPECVKVVEKIMADRPHPEQGYRSALGIRAVSCFSFQLAFRKFKNSIFKVNIGNGLQC